MIFRPAILYVDDEQPNLDTFRRAFGSEYLVKTCLSAQEALQILEKEDFPLVIADQRMPGMTGIELCERLIAVRPQSVRMILTAYTETAILLDAINRGRVHDYVVKPWRKSELKPVIERAFEDYKQRVAKLRELESRASQAERLDREVREFFDFEGLIGASTGLKGVLETVRKAAPTDSTVLVLGETGTGKELIARLVHDQSKRQQGPFVAVHCAALAKTILESELFGHEKGAFTGADQVRIGRFETANGGTIFLDEIGEIPEEVQVKLLRVLQEKEIQRVGGNRTSPVDVRVVAATNRDLKAAVRDGRFREDLFYRLNVISVTVPPLRERKGDVPELASYFVEKFNRQTGKALSLSEAALAHLSRYDWPGNVRELQNIIERAVILGTGPTIEPEDLNLDVDEMLRVEKVDIDSWSVTSPHFAEMLPRWGVRGGESGFSPRVEPKHPALPVRGGLGRLPDRGSVRSQIEQEEIQRLAEILRKAGGNISEAARLMGVARSTLFHRLKKYRLI